MNTSISILFYLHSEPSDQALYKKQGLDLLHPYKVRKCRWKCLETEAVR